MVIDVGHKDYRLSGNVGDAPVLDPPDSHRQIEVAIIQASPCKTLNIEEKQAEQFVFKLFLSKDKLEGQVYQ